MQRETYFSDHLLRWNLYEGNQTEFIETIGLLKDNIDTSKIFLYNTKSSKVILDI